MFRSSTHLGSLRRLLYSLVTGWLTIMALSSRAQTMLNVTNFGARGDAVQFFANTTSNSVVVTTTNQFSNADIGKIIEVFKAGTVTSGNDSYGNSTNGNQDLVAIIANVVNGTNIYISKIAQATLTNTFATYGTDNAPPFSNAIANCTGTNDTINIPSGAYLFVPYTNPPTFGIAGFGFSAAEYTLSARE